MKRINLLLFIGVALCLNISRATAQKNIYFIDYAEVPPEIGYRTGFIVTLQNDTIYGRLRNTESAGSILTPREVNTKYLTIVLKNGGRLPKIAFIPESAPKSEQQKYTPEQIKAFGYLASYFEQRPVELEASYSKSGFITSKALKRTLSLRDPYEDIHLLQRNIYNGFADFESRYVESAKESRFLQRIAEGKMNLYYDTERDVYYVTKAAAPQQLISVNYDDKAFLENTFGDSKQVASVLQAASEMKRAENFVSLVGLYNLEAENALASSGADYVITTKGDTLKGTLQMKGLSNLMAGTLNKVKLTDANGQQTALLGGDIKRIVKYINNTQLVFDAYNSPASGKYYFYQLHVDGKTKLYYDARSTDYFSQGVGDASHSVGSYLVVKAGEQPVLVSKSNFNEQAGKLFADSGQYQVYATGHPEKAQYDYLPQLVKLYNQR